MVSPATKQRCVLSSNTSYFLLGILNVIIHIIPVYFILLCIYFYPCCKYMLSDPLLDSPYYRALRARTLSPMRYYSTYRDLYDGRPWALTRAELIRDRVERALRRDRSLERLERLRTYRSPYLVRQLLFTPCCF